MPTFQYEAILGGTPKISNNIVYNYNNDAASIRTNGLVINNTVMGGYRGIEAENASIYFNIVKDANVGICCGFGSPDPIYHPTIIGNLVVNNTIGIEDWGSHLNIANNTVVNNTFGFRFTSYTFYRGTERKDVTYNNIYGNQYAASVEFNGTQRTINMAYNWWGTTDTSLIAQSFIDKTSDPTQKIVYTPILNEPNPQAMPDPSLLSQLPTMTPTPTPTSTQEPNATITDYSNSFNVESNSTVSAFSFNSSVPEISFNVNGTTGTTGYVKATISKSFMPNGDEIKVYLDDSQINCTVTSDDDAWIIMFTYHHSTHQVKISQAQNSSPPLVYTEYLPYIAAGVIAALLGFLGLIVWLVRTKHSEQ